MAAGPGSAGACPRIVTPRARIRMRPLLALATLGAALHAAPARAQGVDGYASILLDLLPGVERRTAAGETRRVPVSEMRARLFAEKRVDLGEHLRLTAAGAAEGLVADRDGGAVERDALIRVRELHAEWRWRHADLRVGMSRVVWGRLDEFLPTDVVNPIDVARFFLEGRSEARMPVAMIRGRLLPSDRFSLDAIYVPMFRRGRFDELAEATSPFNLAPATMTVARPPARTWGSAQGGLRAGATTGRVDWSVTAYRGFEPLPLYELDPRALIARYPRFTMIGGDVETVRGAWGLRGEVAAYVDRTVQSPAAPSTARGRAVEAGAGVDRRAGDYRISANVLVSKRGWSPTRAVDATDTTLVASVDRSFARQTRTLRVFAVYNAGERSAFLRGIATFALRDHVAVETSGGWFGGHGTDALSRLATRDFVYARLKVFF